MSVKEYLHEAVDLLNEEDADTMLRFLTRFVVPDDVTTKEDMEAITQGRINYKNGDYTTLDEYDKKRKAAN